MEYGSSREEIECNGDDLSEVYVLSNMYEASEERRPRAVRELVN